MNLIVNILIYSPNFTEKDIMDSSHFPWNLAVQLYNLLQLLELSEVSFSSELLQECPLLGEGHRVSLLCPCCWSPGETEEEEER